MTTTTPNRLSPTPSPVGISWAPWRDPTNPDTVRLVVVLSSGKQRVFIGPDDTDAITTALHRMTDTWEQQ